MFQGHVCHKVLKRRSFGATGLIRAVPPYATSTYVTVAKRWPATGPTAPALALGACTHRHARSQSALTRILRALDRPAGRTAWGGGEQSVRLGAQAGEEFQGVGVPVLLHPAHRPVAEGPGLFPGALLPAGHGQVEVHVARAVPAG